MDGQNFSITQLEVLKAIDESIPIYTFIKKDVWDDHYKYEQLKKEKKEKSISFSSIQKKETAEYIFEFINFIRRRKKNNAIYPFDDAKEIKDVLRKQWAGYFQKVLKEQKNEYSEAVKKVESNFSIINYIFIAILILIAIFTWIFIGFPNLITISTFLFGIILNGILPIIRRKRERAIREEFRSKDISLAREITLLFKSIIEDTQENIIINSIAKDNEIAQFKIYRVLQNTVDNVVRMFSDFFNIEIMTYIHLANGCNFKSFNIEFSETNEMIDFISSAKKEYALKKLDNGNIVLYYPIKARNTYNETIPKEFTPYVGSFCLILSTHTLLKESETIKAFNVFSELLYLYLTTYNNWRDIEQFWDDRK